MNKRKIYRILCYLLGLMILALGLTLSTKANLGVSPILTVAYSASRIADMSIGDATLILYLFCITAQIIIHIVMSRKDSDFKLGRYIAADILQLPLSLVFTRVMNVFASMIPDIEGMIPLRILMMLFSIICVGTGAAMSLSMRLVANPADGIVQAISDCSGLRLGLAKNMVDISCVICTCIFSMLAVNQIVGVGLGTLLAMIGTGRVIAVYNKLLGQRLNFA